MRTKAKSGLFLIEMIIAVAFFALSSAVCMNLFVQSRLISGQTREINMAIAAAQSAAESFKAADGSIQKTAQTLSAAYTHTEIRYTFDADWQRCDGEEWSYVVVINVDGNTSLKSAGIRVMKTGEPETPLYGVEVKKYVP